MDGVHRDRVQLGRRVPVARLVEQGWIAERCPRAVVTLHVTDADTPAGNIIERVELGNPSEAAAPYVARLLADER